MHNYREHLRAQARQLAAIAEAINEMDPDGINPDADDDDTFEDDGLGQEQYVFDLGGGSSDLSERGHGGSARVASFDARGVRAVLDAFDDRGPDLSPMDDATAALFTALAEFERRQRRGMVRRGKAGFDASAHPHYPPGTPGGKGGQFMPVTAKVLNSLTEWQAAGGRKTGKNPFDGFTDAQLKKVAKLRGLYDIPAKPDAKGNKLPQLLPGSGRAEIEKRLLRSLTAKEGARRKPVGVDRKSWDTLRTVASGRKVTIAPEDVDGLFNAIAKVQPPPFNLSKLKVSGSENSNLFQRHLRNRPRDTMPQLPTGTTADDKTSAGKSMADFEDFLRSKGVDFEYGRMDPRKLVASQSQLSGPKVAKLFGFMRAGGWKPGGVMIIAKHGNEWAVVDGHHRWAGAAAASIAQGGTFEVDVMRIHRDIDDVLGTPENPKGVVMEFASFEGLGTDREM